MDVNRHAVGLLAAFTRSAIVVQREAWRMKRFAARGFGLILLAGSLLSCSGGGGSNSSTSTPAPPAQAAALDKWHPGIYVKVEDWQWYKQGQVNQINDVEMTKIYNELATTSGLRGMKIVLKWGRFETSPGVYDFSRIDEILAKLADDPLLRGKDKHLILSFPWREFQSVKGASEILPNDLQGGARWPDPDPTAPDWSHIDYDRLWAYKMSNAAGSYGYNIKLWDPTIIARLDAFFAALAQRYDTHPNVTMVSVTESSIGEPIVDFVAGESADLQYAGQIAVIRLMKKYFVQSLVMTDLNYGRPHVANVANNILQRAVSSSKCNG
jgi:hypothetical protein